MVTTAAFVWSIVKIGQVHVSSVALMTCYIQGWVSGVGGVTGADVYLIRVIQYLPLDPFFVPRPPTLLCKTLGVDLSRPSGCRLIQSRLGGAGRL